MKGGATRLLAAMLVAAGLTAGGAQAWAASAEAGEEKVKSKGCVTCHDMQGQGTSVMFPNLAGQREEYLVQQLEAFRSGERESPQMSLMAQNLSDEDIDDLAAYYSGLDPCGN